MSKGKKIVIAGLSIMLILTISIGNTLSYLTRETEKRVNNFTFADSDTNLNAILTEPSWDGIIDYKYENGVYIEPIYEQKVAGTIYGNEASDNMVPGQSANKDPMITNTGQLTDIWVAMKVTFVYGAGNDENAGKPLSAVDTAAVFDAISIDWDTTDADSQWERVEGSEHNVSQVFYYDSILEKSDSEGTHGGKTIPLFSTVTVKLSATQAELEKLNNIGGFSIFIEGFAVQSNVASDYDAFKDWGTNGNIKFTNTPTDASPADVSATNGVIPK